MVKRKSRLESEIDTFYFLNKEDKEIITDSNIKTFYDKHKKEVKYFSLKAITSDFLRSLGFNLRKGETGDLSQLIRFRFGALAKRDTGIEKINRYSYKVIK